MAALTSDARPLSLSVVERLFRRYSYSANVAFSVRDGDPVDDIAKRAHSRSRGFRSRTAAQRRRKCFAENRPV
jgi:hypothetical protein